MNKPAIKSGIRYFIPILLFLVISIAYFLPDILEGKVLFQTDMQQGIALGQEAKTFHEQTGETSRWTSTLFGGMPNYQISPSYGINKTISLVTNLYRLYIPSPASLIFIMMVGFYILMLALKVRWDLAALGAIIYAFSSYFFILIEAGHIWKFVTLAYIPPTIAGILLAYRGKYLAGCLLAAFFASLQIVSNHVQMTYYFLFVILAFVIGIFVHSLKQNDLKSFFKATGVLVVAAILAVGVNISNLYHTYEYTKQTIRGKSELASANPAQQSGGLDKDYIVQWSYGIGETWSLLIPDVKGGGTGPLSDNETAMKVVKPEFRQYFSGMNSYWGDQPFTSGPVYVGAFVVFLFILGIFIVKGYMKWALVCATILSILLSWGKNYMFLTDLFIDFVPMYDKFRAVSSILVIAEFCIPVLAVLALKEIILNPDIIKVKKKEFFISLGITAGLPLIFAIMPDLFFNFLSTEETLSYLPQAQNNPDLMALLNNMEEARRAIFSSDAWRTVMIVLIGAGLVFAYSKKKLNSYLLVGFLTILMLGDMWPINKRYLNSSNFVPKRDVAVPFKPTEADIEILKDKDPNFRVFNTTVNSFNDATTSYFHKSIGGYHAAKLRRYQDLIEHQLSKGNMAVINMLNTKYIIVADSTKRPIAQYNPGAAGNAWFVNQVKWVDNAQQEMEALNNFNPKATAVVDVHYKPLLTEVKEGISDSTATIKLTKFQPNKLIYKATSATGGFAVFSEIYYPGWKVTIDGKPVKEVRTDYVLRGLYIPAGEHEVIFHFDPDSINITDTIAYISFAGIVLLLIAFIYKSVRKKE